MIRHLLYFCLIYGGNGDHCTAPVINQEKADVFSSRLQSSQEIEENRSQLRVMPVLTCMHGNTLEESPAIILALRRMAFLSMQAREQEKNHKRCSLCKLSEHAWVDLPQCLSH